MALRILLVSPYAWHIPGGVNHHIRQLSEAFSKKQHKVGVVAPGQPGEALAAGVSFYSLGPSRAFAANGSVANLALHPLAWRRMQQTIKAFKPDIIHIHEPLVPLANYPALMQDEVPVLATFHAYFPNNPFYRFARPLLRRLTSKLCRVVAVSQAAESTARMVLGPQVPVECLGNPVDVAAYAPREKHSQVSKWINLLFVGRPEPRKGLPILLEAFRSLEKRGFGDRLRLTVVGSPPIKGAPNHVAFLGRVPQNALIRAYQDADVFCAPSTGGESFGIVLVEAMAAGAAVLASDLPGYREVLDNGQAGMLIEPGAVHAWIRALEDLLKDPAKIMRLSQAAQDRARCFDLGHIADRLLKLYEESIGTYVARSH